MAFDHRAVPRGEGTGSHESGRSPGGSERMTGSREVASVTSGWSGACGSADNGCRCITEARAGAVKGTRADASSVEVSRPRGGRPERQG